MEKVEVQEALEASVSSHQLLQGLLLSPEKEKKALLC